MKKKVLMLCLMAMGAFVASAKDYSFRVEKIITGVNNSSTADVELLFSPTAAGKVVYSSDAPTAPLQITTDANGVVNVVTNWKGTMPRTSTVKIYYGTPIDLIKASGTGDVKAATVNLNKGELNLIASGTGDIEINTVNAETLQIKALGTGDVDIKEGYCPSLLISNSGTGDVDAMVRAENSFVSNSGTGDVEVLPASKEMELNAHGTGTLTVKGKLPSKTKIEGDTKRVKYKK